MKSIIQTKIFYSVWDYIEPVSNVLHKYVISFISARDRDVRRLVIESIDVPIRNSIIYVNNAIYDDVCDIIKEMNRND
jgi:hypothetical protein